MQKRTSHSPKPAGSLSAELAFRIFETCQRLRLLVRDARPAKFVRQFLDCSLAAMQEIRSVKSRAFLAISAVPKSALVSEVWYGTTLLSRKSLSAPGLIAKLIFSGISPVAFANLSIDFRGHHTNYLSLRVQQRASTIPWLDRSAYLQKASIVQQPAKRADDSGCYCEIRGQKTMKGISDGNNRIA
jgi:hypothetical protein